MGSPEPITLQLPHIELAGLAYGPKDAPKVLALHGWLDNAATFTRLIPKLPGLRIVALDLAGHGLSGHRPKGCGYHLIDYVQDTLDAAAVLGWERFSLLGHSLGAIVSVLLTSSFPERVERLALVDGGLPLVGEPEDGPARLRKALTRRLSSATRRKPVYADTESAVLARMNGMRPVSREAAEILVQRGLMPVADGFTWRSDVALTVPTGVLMTLEQSLAFARSIQRPGVLVLADDGIRQDHDELEALCQTLPLHVARAPGGHHLHLDDEAGASAVAHCFKGLFSNP
ncbi:alpha/beta fold hydrolase [Pseudomonas matsuisoli]|uniref:Alpha/beta hydrolase n=1 Tax=Pseudomonas matsuisoli TaxID=1515666 RepID=A0A917Q168_9PSED|nr:alpha/beta fold hydrolase [Pseudomonas matsuisoli]GGK05763.1 alpha/beta hydrolase [Pseudomonas matsuisoli]